MKKTLIKIAAFTFSVIFILLIVLGAHIYQVTHKKNNDVRVRQLSRIDFIQSIDSTEAIKIRNFVAGLNGVESAYFNHKDKILVYTYLIGTQTIDGVFTQVTQLGNYQAKKYTVNENDLKTGCPVMNDNKSISGKIIAYLSKL